MVTRTQTRRTGNGWAIAARILAAIPLNYALTSVIVMCLARVLPLAPAQASMAATLASFAIFACLALGCFAGRSVLGLWAWMVGATLFFGGSAWVSIMLEGRL